jgi:hypothetical protein
MAVLTAARRESRHDARNPSREMPDPKSPEETTATNKSQTAFRLGWRTPRASPATSDTPKAPHISLRAPTHFSSWEPSLCEWGELLPFLGQASISVGVARKAPSTATRGWSHGLRGEKSCGKP